MNAIEKEPRSEKSAEDHGLAGALEPGVLVLRPGGAIASADERTSGMLGCADRGDLERVWNEIRPRLESQGLFAAGSGGAAGAAGDHRAVLDVPEGGSRRLSFRHLPDAGVLLVQDADAVDALESDLRLSALMRSLTQITPAVAHDLRAPINAMVFNVEILKETIASGKGNEPGGKERQLRYVNVLKEELHRLHQGMETFIAQISPRGDRDESMDLREPLEELAALLVGPARKQQVRVTTDLPSGKVMVFANRYLLRQALLHISLAALGTVPRDGILEIGLEAGETVGGRSGRVRVRIVGNTGNVAGAGPDPAPGFDVRVSEKGTQAQLWVARSILASQGGEVRPLLVDGEPRAYEVDLTLQDTVSQEKE